MITSKFSVAPRVVLRLSCRRHFGTTRSFQDKNRVYTFVRTPDEFHSLNLLSASSNRPLITLWTATWSSSAAIVSPIVRQLIEEDGIGKKEGGIGYVEIQFDSVSIGDLGLTYMINDIPTLLAFSRGEPQLETKVTKLAELKDREFLINWLENESRRRGSGGSGGRSWFSGLFKG